MRIKLKHINNETYAGIYSWPEEFEISDEQLHELATAIWLEILKMKISTLNNAHTYLPQGL